ncbi:hypothetical protein [Paraburkholderia dioscoreae]|uniref:Uncharacterized protein n=1 Tax=Paraburkholderia dioscoreae TaxID=2604047 RepID=A0A5Q4ZQT6_9BURK|nr:hypothetical protein [Paraburkholderia dioscoreae]VVD31040.1 conserved protein of unknown function [Paraburkholderia dioscoreae]
MNEPLPYPFSDAIEAILLDKTGKRALLLDVLASIVHPDMVCSLFALRVMDETDKVLAQRCIDYALMGGLTPQESAAVYRFIEPRIGARFSN